MFTRALVPTDLSDASDRVITCLQGLQAWGIHEVILMHALGIRHLEVMQYELTRLVEPRLQSQKAMLEGQGFATRVCIAPGPATLEIHRIAEEEAVSLVAIGTHGATLAREVLLGNVAMHVVHSATVPVLVVRVQSPTGGSQAICADLTRPILHPTDFSDTAERAFGYVEELVRCGARRVTLLHVQDQARLAPHLERRLGEFSRIDEGRLQGLRARLLQAGASEVRIEIPYGSPIREIIRHAQRDDHSLIVMGSQGRGFISETFLGSVSHHVVRHAAVPVMLIPALR